MQQNISILGFAGSLRIKSFNRAILRVAANLNLNGVRVEIFDLEGIPLFNQDLEGQPPDKVKDFKAKIRKADAILIATPEYNYSIPGVLKNAIDWASRPQGDNALEGKPVGIMGASIGMMGTARAQYHLRQCFVWLNMHPLNKPEIMVPLAQDKVDQDGNIIDSKTKEKIAEMVTALAEWSKKFK
ncbi:MAG: NAD(P)H-dependent oxidoreductase [Syntrophales bacterium LBB04]|nr:NAD(P)H-dependent oxidoreductase [Syntrophales bacterium LBB04]